MNASAIKDLHFYKIPRASVSRAQFEIIFKYHKYSSVNPLLNPF